MGNIISELRRRKKLSKKALAHNLNVDAGTIDKWEMELIFVWKRCSLSRILWCFYGRYFRNKTALITNLWYLRYYAAFYDGR